jgi:hypothetical protein
MPIVPPSSTLETIQIKVRRLTRTPSTNQLSDTDLQQYINTFVVYDFPEHLRMFNLRTDFTFICNPFQDVYETDRSVLPMTNPLYDFQNRYITVHPPIYIAGYQAFYSQSPEQFFGIYPKINNISSIGPHGDGITTYFQGHVVNTNGAAILANNVLFSSIDINLQGLALVDIPFNPFDGQGILVVPGTTSPLGTINYVTGFFTLNFPAAPAPGAFINSQTVPYVAALPQALMYYDNKFTLRPVPREPHRINFEVYRRPTALLSTNEHPQLNEWWQYIAYGAAKKIFEDRMDMDSVQMIMPEYRKQETLCLRRTIVQYTNERTATIYSDQLTGNNSGWGWGAGGGGQF